MIAGRGLFLCALFAGLLGSGCAGRFVRPTGPAIPEPGAVAAWDAIAADCRGVTSTRAELRVSGEVGGSRFPSLTTGLAVSDAGLAIVATYNARSLFHLAGPASDVVLLDHLEQRAFRGPAPAIVEALVGVAIGPDRLLALLTGCVSPRPDAGAGARVGGLLRVDLPGSRVYLAEDDGGWRLRAAEFDDVVADYRRVDEGRPREIELRRGEAVRLRLRVIELERNPILPASLFQLSVPASYIQTPLAALGDEQLLGPPGRQAPVAPEG